MSKGKAISRTGLVLSAGGVALFFLQAFPAGGPVSVFQEYFFFATMLAIPLGLVLLLIGSLMNRSSSLLAMVVEISLVISLFALVTPLFMSRGLSDFYTPSFSNIVNIWFWGSAIAAIVVYILDKRKVNQG